MATFLPMKPTQVAVVLLGILLAHAGAILFFRYFITIDGPVHVLHAAVLETPWSAPAHLAQGYTYKDPRSWLGDGVLAVLLGFCTPEQAHDLFAALVGCGVVLTTVAFLRAHGTRIGVPVLWLAPLLFNTLLFMGLFHFLLGVSVCFGTVAWWKWHRNKPAVRWAGLLLGAALAWTTHRSAPLLLCLLFLPCFALEWWERHRARIDGRSRYQGLLIGALVLVVGAFQFHRVLRIMKAPMPSTLPLLDQAYLFKTLFILDRTQEQWLVYGIGVLLLIALVAGAWARWRCGRTLLWHDLLILLFFAFSAIVWISNTPHGRRLVIADRAHWLALLALVLWCIALADHVRGTTARVIGMTAACAMLLNVRRLHQAEHAFATLEGPHRSMLEASAELRPNSIVLVAMAGTDRSQQHIAAYMAIQHSGILVASGDIHLSSVAPSGTKGDEWKRFSRDPHWLMRHWRKGIPSEVEQILILGTNVDRKVGKHPWPVLLSGHFRQSFGNAHARIYTAVDAQPAPVRR